MAPKGGASALSRHYLPCARPRWRKIVKAQKERAARDSGEAPEEDDWVGRVNQSVEGCMRLRMPTWG